MIAPVFFLYGVTPAQNARAHVLSSSLPGAGWYHTPVWSFGAPARDPEWEWQKAAPSYKDASDAGKAPPYPPAPPVFLAASHPHDD